MRKYPVDIILKYRDFTNSQDPVLVSLFQNIKKMFDEHQTGTEQKYKKMNLFQESKREKKLTPAEAIHQKVNAICNKLSHDNFEMVKNEMEGIRCEERGEIEVVSKVIYQKSILEHTYSYLYVKLLKKLLLEKRAEVSEWNIRQEVLQLVQKDFVDFIKSEKDASGFLSKNLMGNAIFICSLYQVNFIADSLFQGIIDLLVTREEVVNLEIEFLFYLFKNLPHDILDKYQSLLITLQKRKELSQRIKFLIQDLLDILDSSEAPVVEKKGKQKTLKEIKMETQEVMSNLLQEYPYHGDMTDILDTIKELDPKIKNKNIFIAETMIDVMMEHHEIQKDMYQLILQMVDDKVLKKNNIKEAVINYLENLDDLYLDIPKIHKYFGMLLNHLIKNKIINYSYININLKNKLSNKFYPLVYQEIGEVKVSRSSKK